MTAGSDDLIDAIHGGHGGDGGDGSLVDAVCRRLADEPGDVAVLAANEVGGWPLCTPNRNGSGWWPTPWHG